MSFGRGGCRVNDQRDQCGHNRGIDQQWQARAPPELKQPTPNSGTDHESDLGLGLGDNRLRV
jgi:hypothetical protein